MSMNVDMLSQRVEALEKQLAMLALEQKQDDAKAKKAKKAKKVKEESSDDEKPKKKRVSGYILFSNTNRQELKANLDAGAEKPKNTDVMKGLAVMWKELTDEQREEWNAKAKAVDA